MGSPEEGVISKTHLLLIPLLLKYNLEVGENLEFSLQGKQELSDPAALVRKNCSAWWERGETTFCRNQED